MAKFIDTLRPTSQEGEEISYGAKARAILLDAAETIEQPSTLPPLYGETETADAEYLERTARYLLDLADAMRRA